MITLVFYCVSHHNFKHWGNLSGCQLVSVFSDLWRPSQPEYRVVTESSSWYDGFYTGFLLHNCCRIDRYSSACVTEDYRIDVIKHFVRTLCKCALKVFYGYDWDHCNVENCYYSFSVSVSLLPNCFFISFLTLTWVELWGKMLIQNKKGGKK